MSPAIAIHAMGKEEQQAMEDCLFLELLLNSEVKSLSFVELPSGDEDLNLKKRVASLWKVMIKKCPNLQNLDCDLFCSDDSELTSFCLFSLHFAKLQVLDCPLLECSNQHLKALAGNLPELR
jgi:hypothetical protein